MSRTYLSIFFFMAVLVETFADDFSKTCYTCASPSLRSRWSLTGLSPVADSSFTACDDPSSNGGNTPTEPCSGPCLTVLFDDPDSITQQNGITSVLVVRGCHSTLTQVVADRNSGGSSYCEVDTTHVMSNLKGNTVSVRKLVDFCSTTNCNSRTIQTGFNTPACVQQTQNNLLNNAPLNCYDCQPKEGKNCQESKCSKKYCMKQQVKVDGGFQLYKTCSNVNVLGVDNGCMTYDLVTNPGGVAVTNHLTQCFCRDKQFCNGSRFETVFATVIMFLGAAILRFH
ncbi:unnamed protein product [Caenorhabditis auriculariae]|uniref:Protein quiver n=1 Tax=Caenorhabditis auriculariae TaxID=2777116 RepID=A0A8S1HBP9_9PELO|nr:unnamed protein product [Caenorhabditis auriculariae]